MKCFFCTKDVNISKDKYVSLMYVDPTSFDIDSLKEIIFHIKCFHQVAGSEYHNALVETTGSDAIKCKNDLSLSEKSLIANGSVGDASLAYATRTGRTTRQATEIVKKYYKERYEK